MSEPVLLNIQDGVKRLAGNKALYAKLLNRFFNEEAPLDALVTYLNASDIANARTTAHTLKGMAANLSMTRLYEVLVKLEIALKAGHIDHDAVSEMQVAYEQTKREAELAFFSEHP